MRTRVLICPRLDDPRVLIALFLLSFDAYALTAPSFNRALAQWIACVTVCVGLDAALAYARRGVLLVPFSGFISSLGILLLCDSPLTWVYPAVGVLSILSKHFILLEGRHLFNPNNFGMVFGLLFFSGSMVVDGGRWGNTFAGMAAISCLGALAAYRGRRLQLAASYLLTFLAGTVVRSAVTGLPWITVAAPMTGAAFQLFTFYMITDPMTTPSDPAGRWAYGAAIGLLDSALRFMEIRNAPFYSLFILAGLLPYFRSAALKDERETLWKWRERALS